MHPCLSVTMTVGMLSTLFRLPSRSLALAARTCPHFPPSPVSLQALCLVGEYNNWSPKDSHWAFKNAFGVWELFLPDNADGTPQVLNPKP